MLVVFIHCEYPYKADVLPVTDVAVRCFLQFLAISYLG